MGDLMTIKNTSIHTLKALEVYFNILVENKAQIQASNQEYINLGFMFDRTSAICINLINFVNVDREITKPLIHSSVTQREVFEALNGFFRSWEHFSGNLTFPVPVPPNYDSEKVCQAFLRLEKWTGEYGELRWNLVEHCLSEIQKEYEVIYA